MKKIKLVIVVFFIFINACADHESILSFKVNNSSGGPIKVVYRGSIAGNTSVDSVIIANTVEMTIAVNPEGIGKVKTHKETGVYLRNFSQMDVFKNDTLQSQVDFLKSVRWIYKEIDSYHADYVLTVEDGDF